MELFTFLQLIFKMQVLECICQERWYKEKNKINLLEKIMIFDLSDAHIKNYYSENFLTKIIIWLNVCYLIKYNLKF